MTSSQTHFLPADWPAPATIRAGTTLRTGGFSNEPFDSLNLGAHTGDDAAVVARNRAQIRKALALPGEPAWLEQVHGVAVANADQALIGPADASVATQPDAVCAVLTADCLPVVFCDLAGTCWGAAHAGRQADLMAWMGPAIGPARFEVGAEVRAAFVDACSDDFSAFREGARPGKFVADIYALARNRLSRIGVKAVYGGGLCTIEDTRFYSYRQAAKTGRMATLVWRAG